jgi:hypothetical protein
MEAGFLFKPLRISLDDCLNCSKRWQIISGIARHPFLNHHNDTLTTMNPEQEQTTEHLGDGVYASFDGYAIHLAVNHHMNTVTGKA